MHLEHPRAIFSSPVVMTIYSHRLWPTVDCHRQPHTGLALSWLPVKEGAFDIYSYVLSRREAI